MTTRSLSLPQTMGPIAKPPASSATMALQTWAIQAPSEANSAR